MTNLLVFFFFFQAEDGIRDYKVTGVQTCALPIYLHSSPDSPSTQARYPRAPREAPPLPVFFAPHSPSGLLFSFPRCRPSRRGATPPARQSVSQESGRLLLRFPEFPAHKRSGLESGSLISRWPRRRSAPTSRPFFQVRRACLDRADRCPQAFARFPSQPADRRAFRPDLRYPSPALRRNAAKLVCAAPGKTVPRCSAPRPRPPGARPRSRRPGTLPAFRIDRTPPGDRPWRRSPPPELHPPPVALSRRSEEHTSELQSPCNLVCRLLLEKKKNKKNKIT